MFATFAPGLLPAPVLAQASPVLSGLAILAAGGAGVLAWQLWQARRQYSIELTEQSHLVTEEQERARQAIEEREIIARESQAKSEMLATLSREIRAHLNGVIGSADLLLDNSLQARQRELLTTLRASAESLHQSLNDVLDYSSIETGKIAIGHDSFELSRPLTDVVEHLSPQALLKGLELVMIIATDVPPIVTGDSARLHQVLLNLMTNAVRFTPAGRVVLRVELPAGSSAPSKQGATWVHFSVTDTGPGIPPELEATIFDRFAPSDSFSPRKFGGSGLELAISKRLVELMGGKIGARSLPDAGSEFWVVLPFAADGSPPPTAPVVPAGLHVVVLDDLAASRIAASAMLQRLGVEHDVTDTEAKAADLLRDAVEAGSTDLVLLLDESVARERATEVTRTITNQPRLAATRVFLLSGAPEKIGAGSFGFPITAFVRKPLLRPDVLLEALRQPAGATPRPATDGALEPKTEARQGPSILVVDDDEISRSVTSQLLARLGCIVDLASSGAAAIESVDKKAYDLVFMDCQMPEMDGFTTTERIRAAKGRNAPPIVALTANIGIKDRERCFAVGMCDFVGKPARKAELARVVKTWIPEELQSVS